MSTQPLNIISRYGEDDISLWTVNVEFEDYKRVAGNAVQLKVELSRYLHRGSPPHTRGKAVRHDEIYPLARITPAHAGKSSHFIPMPEHLKGSPPHTRGKAPAPHLQEPLPRITPAHAGKSLYYGLRFLSRPQTRRQEFLPTAPRRAGF